MSRLLARLLGRSSRFPPGDGRRAAPELVLLERPDCHLCEEMERVLDQVLTGHGMSYTRRDVDSDPDLRERFGEVIPVLLRDGRPVAKIRLDRRTLERILRRRR